MKLKLILGIALFALVHAAPASASAILSPTAITVNTMGTFPCCGYTQTSMINQSGLLTPFVSGVTDFDAYLAANPQHTVASFCCEWFSPDGVVSGSLVFDLGAVYSVDRVAAWADEFSGFGRTNVLTGTDGISFALVGAFTPTNHPSLAEGGPSTYGADVAALTISNARYVRFDILGPQTPREQDVLGIGEVAFSVSPAVPEPSILLLVGCGLAAAARRRSRAA